MTQTKEEIRIEMFLNAAQDLAEVIGTEFEGVTLNIKLDDYGAQKQAERLHTKLQDYLDFRLYQSECTDTLSVYRKGKLTITFELEAY